MVFVAESLRNNFWFGTEQRSLWMPTPNSGADVSSLGWESGGSVLNGGGYQLNSFGSHKNYIFEWPASSSREVAQTMKSYADGTYGRGLIYFQDPLTYTTNVLPAMWADPSMGLGYEGASLVYGVDPVSLPTSNWQVGNFPVNSAFYDLGGVSPGWRGKEEAVFVPIPEGHNLFLASYYSLSGSGRVFYRTQSANGALGAVTVIPDTSLSASLMVGAEIPAGSAGVWLWVGRLNSDPASVTLSAMSGRIVKQGTPLAALQRLLSPPWVGGQGNSGCRFIGKPTYVNNTGVNGGQVSFAASFREVGSWVYG